MLLLDLVSMARQALKIATNSIIDCSGEFEGVDHAKEACIIIFEEELNNVTSRTVRLSEQESPSVGHGSE